MTFKKNTNTGQDKIRLLTGVVILITILFLLISKTKREKSRSLNLILITVDTLRADHMSAYGYPEKTTPNIDLWAKDAVIFENVYTSVPYTYPSIATLMTGQYPLTNKIVTNAFSPKISNNPNLLSQLLKKQGFITAGFVSNRFISSELSGFNQGFDYFKEFDAYGYWKNNRKQYVDFIKQSVGWMSENKDKKFFLWVHLMDPHYIYYPSKKYRCAVSREHCDFSNMSIEEIDSQGLEYLGCNQKIPSKDTLGNFQSLYDGDILEADKLFGEIIDQLKEIRLADRSIVILYGDHGEGFDHNYYFDHGDVLYESSIRIPLIIRYPLKSEKQIRSKILLENADIFPTIMDLLQLKIRNLKIDGKSFVSEFGSWPFNMQNPAKANKYLYAISGGGAKYSVFDGRYKYILSHDKTDCLNKNQREELYDLTADLDEKNNLIKQNLNIGGSLKKTLMDHLAKYNLPKNKPKNAEVDQELLDKLKSLGY